MLFYPEIKSQQEQLEIQAKEARTFFENMPENGIAIHGGTTKYAGDKIENGLTYPSACYFYIPKVDMSEPDQKIIFLYQSAMRGLRENVGYAFGDTTHEFSEATARIKQASNDDDHDVTPNELYKTHPELLPSILVYEAPSELKALGEMTKIGFPHEVTASDRPIPPQNLLFEIKTNHKSLSKSKTIHEAQGNFVNFVTEELKKRNWQSEQIKLESVLINVLEKKPNDPLYAETVSQIRKSGIDFNAYLDIFEHLVSIGLVKPIDIQSSHNPMGIYEIKQRYNQILRIKDEEGIDRAKQKILHILGSEKPPLLKKEITVIKIAYLAYKLKQKYNKNFIGIVSYGSAVDKYKSSFDDVDIKVIIKPPEDEDTRPYNIELKIANEIADFVRNEFGKECNPTTIYTSDLEEEVANKTNKISTGNSGLDARCIPIIFGRKNRQLFKEVFKDNLASIQYGK